jgi:subtilisin family serine protease
MSKSSDRRPLFDTLETRQLLSAAASNVVTVNFNGQSVQAVADSYIVQTKNDTAFLKAAAKAGYADVASLGLQGFYSFTSSAPLLSIQKWSKTHGGILSFQPNEIKTLDAIPNDPYLAAPYNSQWAIDNTGQINPNPAVLPSNGNNDPFQAGTPGVDLNLEPAWNITTGSKNVVVAVMDTGIDVGHPDLAANLWVNPHPDTEGFNDGPNGWNAAANSADLTDYVGHGTAVSSAIGGVGNNGIGIVGANWNVSIMMVKIADAAGNLASSAVISGFNYIATQKRLGVNIAALNLSFGAQGPELIYDPVEAAAIKKVTDAGVVVVTSAGNGNSAGVGQNNDLVPGGTQREVAYNPRTLTVAAIDNQGNIASFSNYGAQSVNVGAPGVEVLLAASSAATQDTANTTLTVAVTNATTGAVTNYGYIQGDGTSFASPYTAGVIGLMEAAYEKYHNGQHATADQLVAALKQGVVPLPGLDGAATNGQKLVSTGGRVDAYNSIVDLLNSSVGTNTVTRGNWYGAFGTNGNFIYGATTGTPSLAYATSSLIPTGASVVAYAKNIKSNDPRLLTNSAGTARATGYLYSPTSLSFGFNFGTTTQRLSLYAASVDKPNRTETVSVYDATTGLLLQSVSLSNFASGKYVSFDLTGAVTVSITTTGNAGVVLNGLFLDLTPTVNPASIGTDTTTQGNWQNTYGDLGYVLPGVASSVPSFINFGTNAITVLGRSSGALSPVTVFSSSTRSNGTLTTAVGSSFDIAVNVTDGTTRQVSFYLLNPTSKATATRVQEINPNTAVVTASQDVTVTKGGTYVTFTISGSTTFRFNSLVAGVAPSVSGVFFNSSNLSSTSANTAYFVSSDSTSQGNWLGTYGLVDVANGYSGSSGVTNPSAYYIVGSSTSTLVPTFTGSYTSSVIAATTTKKNALINPSSIASNNRLIGTVSTQTSFSASVDTGSPVPTTLSAYFVDYKNEGLAERVDIVDNTTGAVLSTQVLRNFQNGKYLTWSVTGSVSIVVTRLVGPEAVLSAIFTN